MWGAMMRLGARLSVLAAVGVKSSSTLPEAAGGTPGFSTYTATITGGGTSGTLSVGTDNDGMDEPDGSIHASLQSGTGYSIGSPSSASVTVTDDDPAPLMLTGEVADVKAVRGEAFNSGALPGAAGGTPPYTFFTLKLPPGLSFDLVKRIISGRPESAGEWEVTYGVTTVRDTDPRSTSRAETVETTFTFTVVEPLTLAPQVGNMEATVGMYFDSGPLPQASGGCPPYTYELGNEMGELPPGLGFSTDTFTITGTPTMAGTWAVSYTVMDDARETASQSFLIIVKPAISIAQRRGEPSGYTEGDSMWFTLTTNAAVETPLTVNLGTSETSAFLGTIDKMPEIPAGFRTLDFVVTTVQDMLDEPDGKITISVQPGSGYNVGTPAFVVVPVEDNDVPATVTGLRANGHQDSYNNVALRWDADGRSTSFRARYHKEVCEDDGSCGLDPDGEWIEIPSITTRPSGLTGTREGLLSLVTDQMYRIELKQQAIDESEDWSEYVIVYPTKTAPGPGPTAYGTVDVLGYQTAGAFSYRLCAPSTAPADETHPQPVPTGFDIHALINAWPEAVKWQSGRQNIIRASGSTVTDCISDDFPYNYVAFFSDTMFNNLCGSRTDPACFSYPGLSNPFNPRPRSPSNPYGSPHAIFLRASWDWSTETAPGCTKLESTVQHEAGHAFGLGHGTADPLLMEPQETRNPATCSPTKWDVAIMVANYQARSRTGLTPTSD